MLSRTCILKFKSLGATIVAIVYYPSCRFKEFLPEISPHIEAYMRERYDAVIAGCCRPNHAPLSSRDAAVTICNTCRAIVFEDSPANVKSIWELIASDGAFHFPSFAGERMALQDCWRSQGCHAQQDAVREILRMMNIDIAELPKRRDRADYCGVTLLAPLPAENACFAPKRFCIDGKDTFIPMAPDEQRRAMVRHCDGIAEEKVVCYCVPCTKGILLGGKTAIHLAELVFKMR